MNALCVCSLCLLGLFCRYCGVVVVCVFADVLVAWFGCLFCVLVVYSCECVCCGLSVLCRVDSYSSTVLCCCVFVVLFLLLCV